MPVRWSRGEGLADRIGLPQGRARDRCRFRPPRFDIVFSKDSIVHIPDKHALMAEVFRVLKPGGRFVASDWLIGHDGRALRGDGRLHRRRGA